MPAAQELGEALQTLRERRGLSQRQVAERAGTTQSMVSRYERGISNPEFATVEKIIQGMAYTLGDLDAALREVRGEPPHHPEARNGYAPAEAEAILRPQMEDEEIRRAVDQRVGEILGAMMREMRAETEERANGS